MMYQYSYRIAKTCLVLFSLTENLSPLLPLTFFALFSHFILLRSSYLCKLNAACAACANNLQIQRSYCIVFITQTVRDLRGSLSLRTKWVMNSVHPSSQVRGDGKLQIRCSGMHLLLPLIQAITPIGPSNAL